MTAVPEHIDPLELSRALIRCPSITPEDAGALDTVENALRPMGFTCVRLAYSAPGTATVDNLFAHVGSGRPHLCFAGHTDVVPPGERNDWSVDPFGGDVRDGRLFGRGASDMKAAIACFAAAAERFLAGCNGAFPGTLGILLTGDEEGPAVNGTVKALKWMEKHSLLPDVCLVGEPTSRRRLGDAIKIGRRGSLNARLTVEGVQGHAAYPDGADNPIPRLLRMLVDIDGRSLDAGSPFFEPSAVCITSIDVGNLATNVIPPRAQARFNVRFNDMYTAESLRAELSARLARHASRFDLVTECSGEAFLCPPGPFIDLVASTITRVSGYEPELSTSGGTSDARFIKNYCSVVEFGMPGETAHHVDENVAVGDIGRLTDMYTGIIESFFATGGEWRS